MSRYVSNLNACINQSHDHSQLMNDRRNIKDLVFGMQMFQDLLQLFVIDLRHLTIGLNLSQQRRFLDLSTSARSKVSSHDLHDLLHIFLIEITGVILLALLTLMHSTDSRRSSHFLLLRRRHPHRRIFIISLSSRLLLLPTSRSFTRFFFLFQLHHFLILLLRFILHHHICFFILNHFAFSTLSESASIVVTIIILIAIILLFIFILIITVFLSLRRFLFMLRVRIVRQRKLQHVHGRVDILHLDLLGQSQLCVRRT
mmetsp:Transcript_15374/g.24221  ORF Transcript_15374/g.24221 Transcript_15374/m.24221 type:complete len:257 (-) Transcript_15374:64-834(-)